MAPQHVREPSFTCFFNFVLALVPPFLLFIGFPLLHTAYRVSSILFVEELWYLVDHILEDVERTELAWCWPSFCYGATKVQWVRRIGPHVAALEQQKEMLKLSDGWRTPSALLFPSLAKGFHVASRQKLIMSAVYSIAYSVATTTLHSNHLISCSIKRLTGRTSLVVCLLACQQRKLDFSTEKVWTAY